MSLSIPQQIAESIKNNEKILITCKKKYSADTLSSAIALYLSLQKLNKKVDIVCDNFTINKNLDFLPAINDVKNHLSAVKKFIISLDLAKTKIKDFSYNVVNDKLNIFITPQEGSFTSSDISADTSDFKYSLIFVVDSPDLASLGKVYTDNREFFYHAPIINVDHKTQNENFGQINLIDPKATSTSEILFNLLLNLNAKIIDEDIATALLAGIITATKSFKTKTVTPQSLNSASLLIEYKARREEIIKHLYYNRSLATLKLWGRLLTKLQSELKNKLVWGVIDNNDFESTGTDIENVPDIIDELLSNIPGSEVAVLFSEQPENKTYVLINSLHNHNILEAIKDFHPEGTEEQITILLENINLDSAQKQIIPLLQKLIEKNTTDATVIA